MSTNLSSLSSIPSEITLSNGVIMNMPLNLHVAWAKISFNKLGLAALGISLKDVVITLCLKNITSICPNFIMPPVSLPENVLGIDVDITTLKTAYANYAKIFCVIPLIEWQLISQEMNIYINGSL